MSFITKPFYQSTIQKYNHTQTFIALDNRFFRSFCFRLLSQFWIKYLPVFTLGCRTRKNCGFILETLPFFNKPFTYLSRNKIAIKKHHLIGIISLYICIYVISHTYRHYHYLCVGTFRHSRSRLFDLNYASTHAICIAHNN